MHQGVETIASNTENTPHALTTLQDTLRDLSSTNAANNALTRSEIIGNVNRVSDSIETLVAKEIGNLSQLIVACASQINTGVNGGTEIRELLFVSLQARRIVSLTAWQDQNMKKVMLELVKRPAQHSSVLNLVCSTLDNTDPTVPMQRHSACK